MIEYVPYPYYLPDDLCLSVLSGGNEKTDLGGGLIYFQPVDFPSLWWWGKHLPIERWSLISGCILITAVFFDYYRNRQYSSQHSPAQETPSDTSEILTDQSFFDTGFINKIIFFLILNYTFVHYVIVDSSVISGQIYFLCLKFLLLFYLIKFSIRNSDDFFIIFMTILLCLGYLGVQFWLGNAGEFIQGRLECIPIPSAKSSNIYYN